MRKLIAMGLAAALAAASAMVASAPAEAWHWGYGHGWGYGWRGYSPGPSVGFSLRGPNFRLGFAAPVYPRYAYPRYRYDPYPRYRVRVAGGSHVAWCSARYRTYNPATNTYFRRVGVPAVCHSPYRW
jgi:hypothetical protein